MTYDERAVATALKALKAKGAVYAYNHRPTVIPDATKPWKSAQPEVPKQVLALFLPIDRLGREFRSSASSVDIPNGAEEMLTSGLDFEPTQLDTVTRDGAVWRVISIKRLKPASLAILYYLTVAL
jgi:hypothetical protein